jgi:hypothetical protein
MDAAEFPQVLAEDQVPGYRLGQQHPRRVRRCHGRDLYATGGAAAAMAGGCRMPVLHRGLLAVLAIEG